MKTITLIIGLCLLNISLGANNPSIKHEIEAKVKPNLAEFNFAADYENFVVVSFTVNDFHLEIIDIMGSNELLIKLITEELNKLNVDKIYPSDDIYNFKFIFTKQ